MKHHNQIHDLFHLWMRINHKLDVMEKTPHDFGSGDLLNRSEIHMIMEIGRQSDVNVTDLAGHLKISKSAISQMIRKLSGKNLVEKYRDPDNDKEVFMRLTSRGRIAYLGHEHHHAKMDDRLNQYAGSMSDDEFEAVKKFFLAMEKNMDSILANGL
jgi:DNA-binding MarR family transcriptional regulator